MRRVAVFVCLFVFALIAVAQDAPARPRRKNAAAKTSMPSTKQSAEMKKLIDTFSGHWKTVTSFDKNEWFPVAGTYRGHSFYEAGPAGNSLRERQMSPRANFAGFGLYWYDAGSKSYKGVWCDTMDPRGCGDVGAGNWEGDNFVFQGEIDMGPQGKMKVRETSSNITKDSFDFMIEAATGDAPMKKMMTIKYERMAAKTAPPAAAQPGN